MTCILYVKQTFEINFLNEIIKIIIKDLICQEESVLPCLKQNKIWNLFTINVIRVYVRWVCEIVSKTFKAWSNAFSRYTLGILVPKSVFVTIIDIYGPGLLVLIGSTNSYICKLTKLYFPYLNKYSHVLLQLTFCVYTKC